MHAEYNRALAEFFLYIMLKHIIRALSYFLIERLVVGS